MEAMVTVVFLPLSACHTLPCESVKDPPPTLTRTPVNVTPPWPSVKLVPAMVIDPLRDPRPRFTPALTVTLPLPMPLDGVMVAQLGPVALHPQLEADAVTLKLIDPPAGPIDRPFRALTEKVQGGGGGGAGCCGGAGAAVEAAGTVATIMGLNPADGNVFNMELVGVLMIEIDWLFSLVT